MIFPLSAAINFVYFFLSWNSICGSCRKEISILQVLLLAICFISDKMEVMLQKSSYLSQTRDDSIHTQQYLL